MRCTVRVDKHGRFRCLPESVDPALSLAFLDAECTQPILELCPADPTPGSDDAVPGGHVSSKGATVVAGRRFPNVALSARRSHLADPFYAIAGSSSESPAERYHRPLSHICERPRFERTCKYRRIDRFLELKDFVDLSEPVPTGPEAARLRPRVVVGEDDSRILYDFWDTALEIGCRFAQYESVPDRCLPYLPDYLFRRIYVDPYCQERGVFVCSLLKDNPAVVPTLTWWPDKDPDPLGANVPSEFALLASDALHPHTEFPTGCGQGTGMISYYPECRARRISRLVPLAAFAESKDVGLVMSDGAVGALRDSLPAPPPLRDKITPIRRAVVTFKEHDVAGGFPDDASFQMVRGNYGRFQICYLQQQRPDDDPVFQGEVVVAVTVNKRGEVRSARVVRSTLKNSQASACILRTFRETPFPETSAPFKARVTLSFELVPPPLPSESRGPE